MSHGGGSRLQGRPQRLQGVIWWGLHRGDSGVEAVMFMQILPRTWDARHEELRSYLCDAECSLSRYTVAERRQWGEHRFLNDAAWELRCFGAEVQEPLAVGMLEWRISVGRALLDFPELDRSAIKAKVDDLVEQARKPTLPRHGITLDTKKRVLSEYLLTSEGRGKLLNSFLQPVLLMLESAAAQGYGHSVFQLDVIDAIQLRCDGTEVYDRKLDEAVAEMRRRVNMPGMAELRFKAFRLHPDDAREHVEFVAWIRTFQA